MLSVVLKVLSILGILLLCLLGLAVLLILLVLFFPISYALTGRKGPEETAVRVRASWLFGFLRVIYDYPEPGRILVKVLPFTVYDSEKGSGDKTGEDSGGPGEKGKDKAGADGGTDAGQALVSDAGQPPDADAETEDSQDGTGQDGGKQGSAATESTAAGSGSSDTAEEQEAGGDPAILKKFKKIKYTIRGIYDKIKNIWENISYYIKLLQEEETRLLFSHVMLRLGKIWKDIRPRKVWGQVLFGTGSPDTTGYAYGVYGMMSPSLGDRLLVTPDFTRAVLEGELQVLGHITVFTVLWNGLKLLLDKKLKRFITKMKAGRKK